jgi:hypothetical protein
VKKQNFILIDYENVQPELPERGEGIVCHWVIFAGETQKIPVSIHNRLKAWGECAEVVEMAGTGKNALDFHIAYYLGRLVECAPSAHFYIISKDTGFDPLIRHLKNCGVAVTRHSAVTSVPIKGLAPKSAPLIVHIPVKHAKPTPPETEATPKARAKAFAKKQKSTPNNRPGKKEALGNAISAMFGKGAKLPQTTVDAIIAELIQDNALKIQENGKVLWN